MSTISQSSVNRVLLALAFICALIFSSCKPGTSTVVYVDAAARTSILAAGVKLPPSATNLYYAHQPQFATYLDTWISFSATTSDCLSAAQTLARTKTPTPDFVLGTRSGSAAVTGGPAYHHPEFASPHWNLSTVRNGTMFETNGLFVLIDKDHNRTYIALRQP